jgi:hypothetical protein
MDRPRRHRKFPDQGPQHFRHELSCLQKNQDSRRSSSRSSKSGSGFRQRATEQLALWDR